MAKISYMCMYTTGLEPVAHCRKPRHTQQATLVVASILVTTKLKSITKPTDFYSLAGDAASVHALN